MNHKVPLFRQENNMSKDKKNECNCNHDHDQQHECDCNHDHEGDCCNHQHDRIKLTFDDDETLECLVIGIFDVEDKEYIALLPEDEDEVVFYRYAAINEEEVDLTDIEDHDELELVYKTFLTLIEEEESEE